MRRMTARNIALIAAAAMLTSTSVVSAAPPPTYFWAYAKKKRLKTLDSLKPEQLQAVAKFAQARPGGPKLTTPNTSTPTGVSDEELDLICANDWFVTFDEDADGDPILGTFNLHCAGTVIPLP
jgi:hypothetical protein